MTILSISPLIPYPLIDGGRKGIFFPLKYLAERGHTIQMACLSDISEGPVPTGDVERFCKLYTIKNSRKRTITGLLGSLPASTPYFLSRFHNEALLFKAFDLIEQGSDVVLIEGMHCAYFGLAISQKFKIPVVLRLHNVESKILDRFAEVQRNPLVKAYVSLENWKLRRYEETYCPRFDRVMMISEEDERDLRGRSSTSRTVVVHAGVDTKYFTAQEGREEDNSVLWMAAFQWPPNRDSFWWFVNDIVPLIVRRIPDTIIYIVGSHAPDDVFAFRHPNVRVIGFVDDVRDYMNKCAVTVVPLRIGGGVRLKLFELFAMKKAVVSTSVGCEGMGVEHGRHLVIADDAEGFAESVARLLSDQTRRKELGTQAASFVRLRYSWEETAKRYETVFEDVLHEHAGRKTTTRRHQ